MKVRTTYPEASLDSISCRRFLLLPLTSRPKKIIFDVRILSTFRITFLWFWFPVQQIDKEAPTLIHVSLWQHVMFLGVRLILSGLVDTWANWFAFSSKTISLTEFPRRGFLCWQQLVLLWEDNTRFPRNQRLHRPHFQHHRQIHQSRRAAALQHHVLFDCTVSVVTIHRSSFLCVCVCL